MHLASVGSEALPNGHIGASPASVKPNVTGLPLAENMSLSLWLQTVRHDPLLDTRTTPELPKEADVVVIGSGVSLPSILSKQRPGLTPDRRHAHSAVPAHLA